MNQPVATILCGGVSAALGGFYVVEGLGLLPGLPRNADSGLAICAGALFLFGGVAVMLTLVQGRLARTAISVLSLGILVCMASLFAWGALDSAPGAISGPLAIISPKLNDTVGRIMFGGAALLLAAIAGAVLRGLIKGPGPAAEPEPPPS